VTKRKERLGRIRIWLHLGSEFTVYDLVERQSEKSARSITMVGFGGNKAAGCTCS